MILKYVYNKIRSAIQNIQAARAQKSGLEREIAFLRHLSEEAKANGSYGQRNIRQETAKRLIRHNDDYIQC